MHLGDSSNVVNLIMIEWDDKMNEKIEYKNLGKKHPKFYTLEATTCIAKASYKNTKKGGYKAFTASMYG